MEWKAQDDHDTARHDKTMAGLVLDLPPSPPSVVRALFEAAQDTAYLGCEPGDALHRQLSVSVRIQLKPSNLKVAGVIRKRDLTHEAAALLGGCGKWGMHVLAKILLKLLLYLKHGARMVRLAYFGLLTLTRCRQRWTARMTQRPPRQPSLCLNCLLETGCAVACLLRGCFTMMKPCLRTGAALVLGRGVRLFLELKELCATCVPGKTEGVPPAEGM